MQVHLNSYVYSLNGISDAVLNDLVRRVLGKDSEHSINDSAQF